ncbi:MAG TPA: FG-GAP-like repeat-containing protein [Planctomycetota bacterium]|nr:FG-GAP-like repeat-containing protein [Planctomycetota bacterium]
MSGTDVLFGGGAWAQVLLWEHVGPVGSSFGRALATLGDVNTDSVPDVVVGAETAGPPLYAGNAFLLSGADGATLIQVTGPAQYGMLGFRVAGPGDVTGDGIPDLLVGSLGLGDARLYSGPDGTLLHSWVVNSSASVGSPGDLNGDSVPDLLVGAPTGTASGVVYAFSGADYSTLFTIPGPGIFSYFGGGVSGVGDVNGDGIGDLLIGASGWGTFSNAPGHAYVHSGANGSLLGEPVGPQTTHDSFGIMVAGLGDVTGDGIPDLAVAAPAAYMTPPLNPTTILGEVRAFSGSDFSLLFAAAGSPAGGGENLGMSVAGPGDVDGDGVPDLLAGAPAAPPSAPPPTPGRAGRALLYSGADWSVLFTLLPPAGEYLRSGFGVCGAGDVDADGFPDLAVGAPGTPVTLTGGTVGKVRVYSGAPLGVSAYGQGCPGPTGVVPRIGASKSPMIGTSFRINLSQTAPGRPALLLLGFSNSAWWGTPLPLNLSFLGMPGCSLLVSPDVPVGFATSAFGATQGRVVAPLALPADPSVVGAQFYAQWYVADPGPAAFPGSATRALQIVIQP